MPVDLHIQEHKCSLSGELTAGSAALLHDRSQCRLHRQNQCADAYNIQELHMIRKLTLTLALAATFAIGVAGLSSTPAAAQGWGWHHHRHFFPGFGVRFYGGPAYVHGGPTYAYASCWRPRWVGTRWGTVRKIWVNVCR
jgi:hypothetical protein